MSEELTDRQQQLVDLLLSDEHESLTSVAGAMGIEKTTAQEYATRVREKSPEGLDLQYDPKAGWYNAVETTAEEATPTDTDTGADTDDREDLRQREAYIYRSLPSSIEALATDLGISEPAVEAHLETIREKGWSLEGDDAGNYLGPDQDHLRSSEHKTTRTRTANRWWQKRHDQLVYEFQELDWPRTRFRTAPHHEDWVLHMTDLHAGDLVRRDDGQVVYETAEIPSIIDHITERSLALAETHGARYDTGHLLWGGDFVTNEGIYEGQYEDLDAFLDEQHDALVTPLVRQVKAYAERFDTVQIVCQVGNHGQHRASGVSSQANADLVLYKTVRNVIAQINEHADGVLDNVHFLLGEARLFRDFTLRDGEIKGHLRHGQKTKPQAVTAAGKRDWLGWLRDHQFDVSWVGHHHISGRVPWDGPPIFYTASPKPAGDFVEGLGGRIGTGQQDIATAHGVDDDGVTCVFPIDTRHYTRTPSTS